LPVFVIGMGFLKRQIEVRLWPKRFVREDDVLFLGNAQEFGVNGAVIDSPMQLLQLVKPSRGQRYGVTCLRGGTEGVQKLAAAGPEIFEPDPDDIDRLMIRKREGIDGTL